MAIFKGAGVAIVTPMKENQEVNYEKLEELIEFQIENGTDCIVIAGTTGESSTLSMEEHKKVIEAAIAFTKGRIPVVAGTGSNCTATAVQLSQEAEEAGADGLLIVTPYYNKATQGGLIRHYTTIARSVRHRSSCTMCQAEQDVTFYRRQQQHCLKMKQISWD